MIGLKRIVVLLAFVTSSAAIRAQEQNIDLWELRQKNEQLEKDYQERRKILENVARNYLARNFLATDSLIFNQIREDEKLANQFGLELLVQTIEHLKKSKIPEIKKFMQKYRSIYDEKTIPLFRLSGKEINRDSPTDEKGGFHRGRQSLFMNISKTRPEEWPFIFLHELYHALDEKLAEAVVIFGRPELFEQVKQITLNKKVLQELTPEEHVLLDTWTQAGLDREFFAEFRAWNFCFKIYHLGVSEGLWGKISFVEQVLAFKKPEEKMSVFLYRYLSERAKFSQSEFLNRPIILEKIRDRQEAFKNAIRSPTWN